MKNKILSWIVGIGCGDRRYKIGDVTYTVSSHFEPTDSKNRIKERLEKTIISDFVPLTLLTSTDKIADEYVCSTVGKEKNYAVEEK